MSNDDEALNRIQILGESFLEQMKDLSSADGAYLLMNLLATYAANEKNSKMPLEIIIKYLRVVFEETIRRNKNEQN